MYRELCFVLNCQQRCVPFDCTFMLYAYQKDSYPGL